MQDEAIDVVLTREPLDYAAAIARVTCAEAGGIAVFLGTTRAEPAEVASSGKTGGAGRGALVSLDYHAYDEMALRQMRQLVVAAAAKWPICQAVIWHRLGEV